jgi:hypothetical protein
MRKTLLCLLIILVVSVAISALVFFSSMTNPVPPEVRVGWYMPSQDIVWTVAGADSLQNRTEHFILSGWRDEPPPQFPALSPYSRYNNYTHEGSGNRYMIAVWYFTDETQFRESKKELIGNLSESGKIFAVDLYMTQQKENGRNAITGMKDVKNPVIVPSPLTTLYYESKITTGDFFTITLPGSEGRAGTGILPANKEYYLVYYGTTTPSNLTSQTKILKEVIAETYYYDYPLSQDALLPDT